MGSGRPGGWALLATLVLTAFTAAGSTPEASPVVEETCKPCNFVQAAASFGVLFGEAPLQLRPLDLLHVETASSLPLANPVLTALELTERLASITDTGSNSSGRAAAADAISHPTLATTTEGRLLMFFAAHACGRDRWGIAAAESPDGRGTTWQGLGMVLENESVDIRAPSLFQHNGSWYLVPQVAGQQDLRLFKAASFPYGWQPAGVLLDQPLEGASIVQHGKSWWLLGHKRGPGQGGQNRVLAAFQAQSPLGPWTEHTEAAAMEAATAAGSMFAWDGGIYRLGRSCKGAICGGVQALQLTLSGEAIEQKPVGLDLGLTLWKQRAGWASAGWTHLAVGQLADGSWLAVVEASQLPPVPPTLSRQLERAIVVFRMLALLCIVLLVLSGVARVPAVRCLLLKQRWGMTLLRWSAAPGSHKLAKVEEDCQLPGWGAPQSDCEVVAGQNGVGKPLLHPSSAKLRTLAKAEDCQPRNSAILNGGSSSIHPIASSSSIGVLRQRLPPWRLVLAAAVLIVAVLGAGAAQRAQRIAKPFYVQPHAVPVEGQWSRFTLMVMSYSARLQQLDWYVSHYSQCPSVGEILVVWNQGPPPDAAAFQSDVPVRVRVESVNSMNNRFRPDPAIQYRSVLSLDDDILIPCTTIESSFAQWRAAPSQLAGYYPRLLVPPSPGHVGKGGKGKGEEEAERAPVYEFEEFVFQRGAYNAILAGAAFMDSATFFPLYFSAATAPARALVDEVFNCDDLLLNFVVANWTAAQAAAATAGAGGLKGEKKGGAHSLPPSVQLIRPERRIDVSRMSGVGISHNPAQFKAAADRCLSEFTRLFDACRLVERKVAPHYGKPPNCHLWLLDCVYLQ